MKIIIWGTGKIATRVWENGLSGEVVGFLETVKKKDTFESYPVFDLNTLPEDFNWIIVANSFSDEIYNICVKTGLALEKIIFLKKATR